MSFNLIFIENPRCVFKASSHKEFIENVSDKLQDKTASTNFQCGQDPKSVNFERF